MHSKGLLFQRGEVKPRLRIKLLRMAMGKENGTLLFVNNNVLEYHHRVIAFGLPGCGLFEYVLAVADNDLNIAFWRYD